MSSVIELWVGTQHLSVRQVHERWLRPAIADSAKTARFDGIEKDFSIVAINLLREFDASKTVKVIVSDAHCRYLLLPRPVGARNRAELEAAVTARFHASFGDNSENWSLRIDSAPQAQHDLTIAIRRHLLDKLEQLAIDTGKRLQSVQPLWVWSAAQSARQRSKSDHWLVVAQGKVCTAGLFRNGSCVGVRSSQQFAQGESLSHILMRESSLYASSDSAKAVFAFGKSISQTSNFDGEWNLHAQKLPDAWEQQGGV